MVCKQGKEGIELRGGKLLSGGWEERPIGRWERGGRPRDSTELLSVLLPPVLAGPSGRHSVFHLAIPRFCDVTGPEENGEAGPAPAARFLPPLDFDGFWGEGR